MTLQEMEQKAKTARELIEDIWWFKMEEADKDPYFPQDQLDRAKEAINNFLNALDNLMN